MSSYPIQKNRIPRLGERFKGEPTKRRVYNLYTKKGVSKGGAYSNFGANWAVIHVDRKSPLVAVHESGHAFCWLQDEYVPWLPKLEFSYGSKFTERNCEDKLPLDFLPYGKPYAGCDYTSSKIRSSEKSIMKYYEEDPRFNVWSCAYCLDYINQEKEDKEKPKEYAEQCKKMNTVSETWEGTLACMRGKDCEKTIGQPKAGKMWMCYDKGTKDPSDDACIETECVNSKDCKQTKKDPELVKAWICDDKGTPDPSDNKCVSTECADDEDCEKSKGFPEEGTMWVCFEKDSNDPLDNECVPSECILSSHCEKTQGDPPDNKVWACYSHSKEHPKEDDPRDNECIAAECEDDPDCVKLRGQAPPKKMWGCMSPPFGDPKNNKCFVTECTYSRDCSETQGQPSAKKVWNCDLNALADPTDNKCVETDCRFDQDCLKTQGAASPGKKWDCDIVFKDSSKNRCVEVDA
jgi:hypothetical protein